MQTNLIKFIFSCFMMVAALLALVAGESFAQQTDACWKDSSTRPVAQMPTQCPGGQMDAGLCYNACPTGWTGVGPVCHQNCPAGFGSATAVDISCSKPSSYTRGAYTIGDRAGCEREGAGRACEEWGAMWRAAPRPGFQCVNGDLICSPACPAGMQDQGLFCAKQAAQGRGVGTLPGCPAGQQNQAGLCYNACPSATDGVGVVCWGQCAKTPAYPVDCGAMCGKNADACVRAGGSMALTTVKFVADAIKGDVPDVDAVFKAYALDICSDAQKKQTNK